MSPSDTAPKRLFSPLRKGTISLENRLAVAPMTRISATPAGVPTDAMVRYYEGFARGGFGLVMTEGLYTDQAYAQGYAGQPGLTDTAQEKGWRSVIEAVHTGGSQIFAQLMHAGALAQFNRFRSDTIGPSAIQPKGQQMPAYAGRGPYPLPRAMTAADIQTVINGFVDAAQRARDGAGFDGVEIHGANGYLLDQFLTDYTNQRDDAWGGTLVNRLRLLEQIIQAVRAALGADYPLGIRLSQGKVNDYTHKWSEAGQGAATLFSRLAAAGVDFIHLTEFEAWKPAFTESSETLVAHLRRAAPEIVIIANGGLHDPERAEHMLNSGADIVSLGRGALSNPDWPRIVSAGQVPQKFDMEMLSPVATIKPSELAQRKAL